MASGLNLFIHCFPPARGGSEYLAQQFVSILKIQYSVHIFTGRGQTLDSYKTFDHYLPPEANPNIHRLPLNQFRQRIYNRLLSKLILRHGYFSPLYFGPILQYSTSDLQLISQSQKSLGIAMPTKSFVDSYKFAKKYQQRLTLIPAYHNVNYYNHNPQFQKAFDYAHKVFYLTPFERHELCQSYQVSNSKLVQTTFCPYNTTSIKLRPLSKKTLIIGFIGQITLRKNLGVFADYLQKYQDFWKQKGIDLKVYLAGARTNSSPQVETLFSTHTANTTFIYDFPEITKSKQFQKIDIFINPSQQESLGIVNFEALYHGCRLIIHQNSAFASIDSTIPGFTTIDNLNQQIASIVSSTSSQTLNTFDRHSLAKFQKIVIQQF